MDLVLKVKVLLLLVVFLLITSCSSKNKVNKKDKVKETNIKSYNLKLEDFPKQSLIVNDTNFIVYLDISKLNEVSSFKKPLKFLLENYYLNNVTELYLTASDIYKSQEFLFFIKNFQINLINKENKKEVLGNRELIKTVKTDNQQFAYINFDNSAIYGDDALVKELFHIYDNKVSAISSERYKLFTDSSFLKSKKALKLIFIPNKDYRDMLIKHFENQVILKPLFEDINYVLLELDINDAKSINISFVINSKKESIDLIFNFINTQKELLMTLNGSPYSNLDLNKVISSFDLLKNLKVNKINNESLEFFIKVQESDIKKYIK